MTNSENETQDRERDQETGRYAGEFPDEDFLTALKALGGAGGTTEVADKVGCDRRTAYVRLNELEDQDQVSSRKVGNALLWSLND